ncbi:hypothetical protein [Pseudobdellovibrio exovorus]|uniref:PilZ domain-containing protein n=1 Tax=Pseudobdellovibrio exovorus JSS TaxID=1184267 RepID=M4VQ75_9BACT|nr:hypothetical protein [Pseudobdellovibrio exovorus]AGH95304.1 hypothetical protein A11Q_1088 [Pseudobdellovibrio exovorus JSS]
MAQEFWVLYDPNQKLQTEKMSDEETQFSLMKMKTKEINGFLIWKNSWPKWRRLKEFLDSDDSPFMSTFLNAGGNDDKGNSASSLQMKPVDQETEKRIQASFSSVQLEEVKLSHALTGEQFSAEQLENSSETAKPTINFKNLDKSSAFSKSNKEDKFKIELLLVSPKGTMFRSIAKNISLSGTFSERIVPDEFHHSPFDLIIINSIGTEDKTKRITLKAKVIITDSSIYLEYINPSEDQKAALRTTLDQYVQASQKLSSQMS